MTTDPESKSTQPEPAEGESKPKSRRRRRRGKPQGGGEGGTEVQKGSSQGVSRDGARGERKSGFGGQGGVGKRRRGGGGRRRDGDSDQYDDVDANPTRRRKRPQVERNEHWDEIFEERSFADLGLRNSVIKGVEEAGFTNPTKVQSEMIPVVLDGKDVLGQSRTGTGKTAAFGLPLYHLAIRDLPFQSIILAPTRELAIQIASELEDLGQFTPIRVSAVYGGQHIGTQAENLEKGPEVIVATPGRLMDMKNRGHIHFDNVRFVVLDEVDRMLDIGFRDDIKTILSQVKTKHQTLLVSATISDEIEKLARTFMTDPVRLTTAGGSLTVSLVEQHYMTVNRWDKRRLMLHVLTHEEPDVTLVFCRMKRTVDELARYLKEKGVDAHAIHGDMYQGKRNSVMRRLRSGQLGVLVASDLAARGLDVDDISHVINYDLPEDPEIYIHRIGRTARAGRGGVAWSLVTPEQGPLLTEIEKLANVHIPEKTYDDFESGPVPHMVQAEKTASDQRLEKIRSVSRYDAAPLPAEKPDPTRFPGGLVPTKLPPKKIGGRVKTARSMKKAVTDQLGENEAPPKND